MRTALSCLALVLAALVAMPAVAVSTKQTSRPSEASCPCDSGRICTGPRGGRYCITKTGKKRYLGRAK